MTKSDLIILKYLIAQHLIFKLFHYYSKSFYMRENHSYFHSFHGGKYIFFSHVKTHYNMVKFMLRELVIHYNK